MSLAQELFERRVHIYRAVQELARHCLFFRYLCLALIRIDVGNHLFDFGPQLGFVNEKKFKTVEV